VHHRRVTWRLHPALTDVLNALETKRADVQALAAALPTMHDWPFKMAREVDVHPVLSFREHMKEIGLLRRYSAERTIIDLFRLSHDWGSDLGIEALKRWLRGRGNSPSALLEMARDFPKGRPALQNALDILL
jgi:hypothetical protein